jgi:16S rRNA G966 N2-methylase RsmD
MNIAKRISKSIQNKGLNRSYQSLLSVFEDYYFDQRYYLNTMKITNVKDLDISEDDKQNSFRYQPTRRRHFRNLMNELIFPDGSVFVDLGSGKGRVLLMASEYNFSRIVGVEISRELCNIAKSNLKAFESKSKQCLPVEIVELDVSKYRVNEDENIFYLFKPFNDFIMKQILENITTSLKQKPRKVWLIFNNFQYQDLFAGDQIFKKSLEYAYGGAEFIVYEGSYQ